MKGKTSSGFEYTIDDEAKDDMELLDALVEIDEGEPSGISKATLLLLGKDQKKALYEHCRTASGRVSAAKVIAEFTEILNAGQEDNPDLKN